MTDPSADPLAGFRLERLDLWNWGTFHGGIQSLQVDGGWALIVGDNGSGKSTAIDALRTLLVPPRLLNYNDASGDGRRAARDRTRRSYVRGAWASSSVVDSTAVSTQHLREPGALSGIAAAFRDASRDRSVTVAQILWEHDERVSEIYALTTERRSLRDLVAGHANTADLKRTAKRNGWEIEDNFSAYAERMRGLLCIPGDKALEVFNRAIGMKEVGDVDAFVRQFMLPAADTYGFVRDTVLPQYRTLLDCWNAIARADRQIALLTPVREATDRVTAGEGKIADWRRLQDFITPFVATLHLGLLRTHLGELHQVRDAGQAECDALKMRVDVLRGERDALVIARASTDVGRRLDMLEKDIQHANEARVRATAKRQQIAPAIALMDAANALASPTTFASARVGWETRLTSSEREALEHDDARAEHVQEKQLELRLVADRKMDLDSATRHRVNIPHKFLEIRSDVASAVGVAESDLPFAGELMEVLEDHADWAGAIERLLGGFGLSLIVPERHYRPAAHYINSTWLGLRLTFHRVPSKPVSAPTLSKDRVPGRMAFRTEHPLHLWVAAELARSFNHRCCASIAELEQADFGLTREGLVRGGTRHVKDDRSGVGDQSNRVLGWSVERKIAALRQRIEEHEARARENEAAAESARQAATRARSIAAAATALLAITDFADIDSVRWSEEAIRLKRERDELAGSSEKLRSIEARLVQVDHEIDRLEGELRLKAGQLGGVLNQIEIFSARAHEREGELDTLTGYEHHVNAPAFSEFFEASPQPSVSNCDQLPDRLRQRLQRRINQEQTQVQAATESMLAGMSAFLNEFAEHRQLLSASRHFADGFVAALDRIILEELPRHRERFEQYLSENLVGSLVMLQRRLDEHHEDIETRIDEINSALEAIKYTDDTYVELRLVPKPNSEVSEFRRALRECLEYGIEPAPEERLQTFERVRRLLETFERETDRTQRVVDVRNWLAAGIRECRRTDRTEVNFYAVTTGKSGGQKAKLAFTILASALSAQYGLSPAAPEGPQFRLVVIDEAFSRTDESNSTRAMQLFAQLGFQVIIVGPFDAKAKLAVPFVGSIHLVTNSGANDSRIVALSRAEVENRATTVEESDAALLDSLGSSVATQ